MQSKSGLTNRKSGTKSERPAEFMSFAQGRPSYIERNWAKHQAWAVIERPDRQFAPCLTDEARRVLEVNRVTDDHR
jgi:hypothetical protein